MINTKLLTSLALLSLIAAGCTETEEKTTPNEATPTKKVETPAVPVQTQVEAPVEKIAEKIQPVVQEVKKVIVQEVAKPNGVVLYKKCAACHGATAEKSALNKSEVIKGWDETKIFTALKGYQDGTYGGAMKGLMKSQVGTMTQEEIKVLSAHIATF